MTDIGKLATEQRNAASEHIDRLPTLDMVRLINNEDKKVAGAVEAVCPQIAEAIDGIYARMQRGGRLIYTGCGTSGRLGVLDAAECPPTYSTDPERVRAVIAGGYGAMFAAVEGAEDDCSLGTNDLKALHLTEDDSVVGIAASGRTPYVLGALDYAKSVGALTIAVTCCPGCAAEAHADIAISPAPGPEVITGSTRMKSGTAQKMILNMLSTGVMVKLGKVYGNLMVDVKASNEKLRERCVRIVRQATGAEDAAARAALIETNYACKPAIVMLLLGVDKTGAETLLTRANGRVAAALEG